MDNTSFLEDLQQRLSALLAASPAGDIQQNLKALLVQQFAKLDLVTREEFEVQRALLERAAERIETLEARLAELDKPGTSAP